MRENKTALDTADINVVLVGMGKPAEAEKFRQELDVVFPLICDPEKYLYGTYGLKKAAFGQIVSPGVLLKGLQAVSQGHFPGRPQGDPMQMPGTFIINKGGRFLLQHFARDATDHLTVGAIIDTVQKTRPL